MKKFFLMVALLAFAGLANAANIQTYFEPKSGGPEIWTDQIYNASNTDFDVGDVVIWTIGDSTGDNDNWVTTSSTGGAAETKKVAGIVYPNAIASGDIGSIAIWGTGVAVDTVSAVTAAGDPLCAATTAGSATKCVTTDAGIYSSFGFCTSTPASSSCVARIIGN